MYHDNSLSGSFLDNNVALDTERRARSFGLADTSVGEGQVAVLVFLIIFEET